MSVENTQKLTLESMYAHLKKTYIGYRKGDPTIIAPPNLPPPKSEVSGEVIDLRKMSQDQIMEMCRQSKPRQDPFADLLPEPPGVHINRLAYFTGKEAPKHHKKHRKASSIRKSFDKYENRRISINDFSHEEQHKFKIPRLPPAREAAKDFLHHLNMEGEIPWSIVGYPSYGKSTTLTEVAENRKCPRVAGVEVALRRLWDFVQEAGGFDSVCDQKLWQSLVPKILIMPEPSRNAGHSLKSLYQEYIQRLERYF